MSKVVRIHPMLFSICKNSYKTIIQSSDQLVSFKEQFNILPRAVLECAAREQLLPETEVTMLHNRLQTVDSEMRNLLTSLEQRDRDCALLQQDLRDLHNSHSWRLTAPLRAFRNFFGHNWLRSIMR